MDLNIFLESDDDELEDDEFKDDEDKDEKKKKKDEDDDDDSDKDDDDDFDDDDDSSNDYIGDEDESSSDEDFDGEDEFSGDGEGDSGNDYLDVDVSVSSSEEGEGSCECGNMIAKVAYAICVACNNFQHVHFMCAGKKFDTVHGLTDNLIGKVRYKVDTIAELALEDESLELDNFCNAAKYVPEIHVETEKEYDYETACTAVADTLGKLIEIVTQARENCCKSHVQSTLDDFLVTLNKENNFLMKRRMKNMDESADISNSYV